MRGPAQASAAIDGGAIVVALAQISLSCMQGHAHTHQRRGRPWLGMQHLLKGSSSSDGIGRTSEHGKPAVTFTTWSHHASIVLGDDLLDQRIMPDKCLAHRRGMLLQERSA